jgi:hypothetical protein
LTTTTDNRKQQTVSKQYQKHYVKIKNILYKKGVKVASRPGSRQQQPQWPGCKGFAGGRVVLRQ